MKDMKAMFAPLEPENIQESIQESIEAGDGKVSYVALAKKYSPSELSQEKISSLVDTLFPLLGKDKGATEKDKKARNAARNKMKTALKERAEAQVKKDLQPPKSSSGRKITKSLSKPKINTFNRSLVSLMKFLPSN